MALNTGMAAQLMIAEETTWGTAATPTRGLPLVSETVTNNIAQLKSQGIIAGAIMPRTQQRSQGVIEVGGDINLELYDLSIGLLLKHIFGVVATTGAGPYTHTFTPGLSSILGKGLTMQKGVPNYDGTGPDPFNLIGCKIDTAEISFNTGDICGFKLGVIAKNEDLASPALASVSYASGITPYTFVNTAVTVGGSAVKVRSGTLTFNNAYERRMFAGQQYTDEPTPTALRQWGGTLTLDKLSLTQYQRYTTGTEAAVVVTFTKGAQVLTITYNAAFVGATPPIAGMAVVEQPLVFEAQGSTTDAGACTATFVTTESTP